MKRKKAFIFNVCMMLMLFLATACAKSDDTKGSEEAMKNVYVTEAPYNATGDGTTNDREALQKAIDDVYAEGGGVVTLTADKTFLSGNIVLRSNVTLHFEDGAILKQSERRTDYVKPVGDTYEPYEPKYGHNSMDEVRWGHAWYENWPLVYAGEGTKNIKITGNGTIEMTRGDGCELTLHMCPVGLYRVDGFEISDITITECSNYGMMPYSCKNGLIKNVTMNRFSCKNGDGISLMNCQDIRITDCYLDTTDDAIYIFTSYADPRGETWWSSNEPQPSKNIEIDNNVCMTPCKAFGFILWGSGCQDQSLVEVSNVYVHDNKFTSMGIWNDDPFDEITAPTPAKNIRFENNEILKIQDNFYETPISDMNLYDCMTEMKNGDFENRESYWTLLPNENEKSAGVASEAVGQDGTFYGYIEQLDKGDAKIYQGLKLESGKNYSFKAKVQSSGTGCRMFVRNLDTQELVASLEFNNTEWAEQTLTFEVPETGNYHIGIERGDATEGWARIDSANVTEN